MTNNINNDMTKGNTQNEKFYEKSKNAGEHRAEMLKLEILYQKIMKQYEV